MGIYFAENIRRTRALSRPLSRLSAQETVLVVPRKSARVGVLTFCFGETDWFPVQRIVIVAILEFVTDSSTHRKLMSRRNCHVPSIKEAVKVASEQ